MLNRWFISLQATEVLPPDSNSKVFDDACGIGTVTAEVKKAFPDIPVLAIDSAPGMLEVFNRKAKKHHFKNVETRLLDGGDLTGTYIHTPSRNVNLVYVLKAHFSLFFFLSFFSLFFPFLFLVQTSSKRRPRAKLTHPRRRLRQLHTRFRLHFHRPRPQRFRLHQRALPRHRPWRCFGHEHLGRPVSPEHWEPVGQSLPDSASGLQSTHGHEPDMVEA